MSHPHTIGASEMHARPPLSRRATTERVTLTGILAVVVLTATATPAAAHERWFTSDAHATAWSFASRPLALFGLAAALALTFAWRAIAARLRSPELPFLERLSALVPLVPRLLGIHLGVSLLALASRGNFLSPSLPLDDVPAGAVFVLLEAAVGVWLITGVRLRQAAMLLIALGPALVLGAGPVALLENAALVGVAGFLVLLPPSDAPLGAVEASPERIGPALLLLRVGAGISLVSLAFSEKFSNPDMARGMLADYPQLNVFASLGIPLSTDAFIILAASVEVLFGLLILSGAAPQLVVPVAFVPFNLTLLLFGSTELIGHLPVYGVLLALLVYGSSRQTAHVVPAFRFATRTREARSAEAVVSPANS